MSEINNEDGEFVELPATDSEIRDLLKDISQKLDHLIELNRCHCRDRDPPYSY